MCVGGSLGSPSHGAHAAQACTRGPGVHTKVVVQTTYTPTGMLMQGVMQALCVGRRPPLAMSLGPGGHGALWSPADPRTCPP